MIQVYVLNFFLYLSPALFLFSASQRIRELIKRLLELAQMLVKLLVRVGKTPQSTFISLAHPYVHPQSFLL